MRIPPAMRRVLLPLLPLAACADGNAPPSRPRPPALRVTAMAVEERPLAYRIESVGSIEARETVFVPARVEGTLEALAFEEGQAVVPETVLAVIDAERFALEVERARAALAAAESAVTRAKAQSTGDRAALEEAEGNLARRRALREKDPGWVSEEVIATGEAAVARMRANLDVRRAGEQEAEASLAQARAHLALAEKNLADARVRAPLAGTIERKHVAAGQYVKSGDRIATIVDTSQLRLRFTVTEAEAVRLSNGQAVSFRVQPYPGREFRAALFHVGSTADPSTRMVGCLGSVEEGGAALKPGFFASVEIEVAREERAIVVPAAAILPTERGFVAFVVEEGRARRRDLRLGLHTPEGDVEVLSGLRAGETLVVLGAAILEEGSAVEVVPGAASRPSGG
ncbi:MAG: efflux RND transporter periplasmic adaptor subunit [Planctomycetes bacterium]|nr:efflux RND transporter periplasmic adaptor subunit [Planctomycetota bacterium]